MNDNLRWRRSICLFHFERRPMQFGNVAATILVAAAIAAPGIANAGSTSNQCASLNADWRAIHDNVQVMHVETTMRVAIQDGV
jgi:hypothetical protein